MSLIATLVFMLFVALANNSTGYPASFVELLTLGLVVDLFWRRA